jgi:prevent-host-death family protein
MASVSIRELRNHGGGVIDRAARGERITITRSGRVVAELRPAPDAPLDAEVLLRRWRGLPALDLAALRRDLDEVLAPEL